MSIFRADLKKLTAAQSFFTLMKKREKKRLAPFSYLWQIQSHGIPDTPFNSYRIFALRGKG